MIFFLHFGAPPLSPPETLIWHRIRQCHSSFLTHRSVSRAVGDSAVEALRLPREERVALVRYETAVIGSVVSYVGLSVGVQEQVAEHDVVAVTDGLEREVIQLYIYKM